MKKAFHTVILAMISLLVAGPVLAQSNQCNIDRDVKTKALDEPTWKRLNSIYEEVGEENYQQAYEELQVMLRRVRKDEYLEAIIYQALAQVECTVNRHCRILITILSGVLIISGLLYDKYRGSTR